MLFDGRASPTSDSRGRRDLLPAADPHHAGLYPHYHCALESGLRYRQASQSGSARALAEADLRYQITTAFSGRWKQLSAPSLGQAGTAWNSPMDTTASGWRFSPRSVALPPALAEAWLAWLYLSLPPGLNRRTPGPACTFTRAAQIRTRLLEARSLVAKWCRFPAIFESLAPMIEISPARGGSVPHMLPVFFRFPVSAGPGIVPPPVQFHLPCRRIYFAA